MANPLKMFLCWLFGHNNLLLVFPRIGGDNTICRRFWQIHRDLFCWWWWCLRRCWRRHWGMRRCQWDAADVWLQNLHSKLLNISQFSLLAADPPWLASDEVFLLIPGLYDWLERIWMNCWLCQCLRHHHSLVMALSLGKTHPMRVPEKKNCQNFFKFASQLFLPRIGAVVPPPFCQLPIALDAIERVPLLWPMAELAPPWVSDSVNLLAVHPHRKFGQRKILQVFDHLPHYHHHCLLFLPNFSHVLLIGHLKKKD